MKGFEPLRMNLEFMILPLNYIVNYLIYLSLIILIFGYNSFESKESSEYGEL